MRTFLRMVVVLVLVALAVAVGCASTFGLGDDAPTSAVLLSMRD